MKKSVSFALLIMALGTTALTPIKAQDDLVYVAVVPCRIVDTRNAGGAIIANTSRNFWVSGTVGELAAQGGTTNCLDPKAGTELKPLAISAYIVAVPASTSTGGGVLTAYPSDQLPPAVGAGSSVNFAEGQIIGNTTNVTLCDPEDSCPTDGEFAILARNTNQHVVIDVQGYFYRQLFNMESVVAWHSYDANEDASSVSKVAAITCPSGSIMSGGGVRCSSNNVDYTTTNYGVVHWSTPSDNSYIGSCVADATTYMGTKFGPPVTAYAVCLFDEKVTPLPTATASEETQLLVDSLRNELAERQDLIDSFGQ